MRAPLPVTAVALSAWFLSLPACMVVSGNWERFHQDFHYSYRLSPGGRLTVESFNGEVEVSAWDRDTVDVSGTKYGPSQLDADQLKVHVDAGGDAVWVRVAQSFPRRMGEGARFTIKIPRGTRVDRITTSNGGIRVQDSTGTARLRTSNGPIRVTDLRGDLEANTSNARVELQGVDGNARAVTSNGSIMAGHLGGALEAVTSNGSVQADIARADQPVHVETSNSSVELSLPPRFFSNVHAETSNGAITLHLAEGANARLSAHTSNASISSEWDVRPTGVVNKNHLEGVIGAGGPLIELNTSNGGIHLLRQ